MKTIITFTIQHGGEIVVAITAAIIRKIEMALLKRKQRKGI
jgi:hypothetical protein